MARYQQNCGKKRMNNHTFFGKELYKNGLLKKAEPFADSALLSF